MLEKAKSGNIDALTIPEIKVILDVNERLGRKQLQLNREGLDKAGKVPNADPALLGLYSVDDPTTYQPKKKAGGTGNPLVDKYLE